MNAKLSNFSELSNILSVKSSLRTNLMALFTRFGLYHLLCKLSLEKEAGKRQVSPWNKSVGCSTMSKENVCWVTSYWFVHF